MRVPLNLFIFLLFLLGLSQPGHADNAGSPAIEIKQLEQQLIRKPAQFLVTDPAVTIEALPEAEFRPLTDAEINQGISDQAFWIRFSLKNSSNEAINWILAHKTAYLDHIELFLQDAQSATQHIQLSDRHSFSSRLLPYRTLAIPHTTAGGGITEVYLKLYFEKADSVTLDFELSDAAVFIQQQNEEYLLYGLFYGAMLLLMAISFLGAVLLGQWLYLLYTGFLLSSTLMWALLNGFAYQYLWPTSVFWHNEGFHIIFLLVAATAILFSRQFLMTHLQFPRLDKLLRWLPVLFLIGILLRFAGFYEPVLYLAMAGIISLVLLSLLGLKAYLQGLVYARWYALAWLVYGCGLALSVTAATTSLLPWGMNTLIYAQLGAIVEALMLLLALGDKVRHWERDHQQILQLVQQDPLTGLGNRRLMPEAINSLYNAFLHNGKPVFMALLDLDDFKQINDRFGHEAGDEVIKLLASLMQTVSRSEDVCIRQGGDEFLILFQAGNEDKAIHKIDRLRRVFYDNSFQVDGSNFSASLSAGLSILFSADKVLSEQTAFRRADRALYRAKQAGGNQCLIYQSHSDALGAKEPEHHYS
jgi:diguanylate cyclase (GGDEF)-like protein